MEHPLNQQQMVYRFQIEQPVPGIRISHFYTQPYSLMCPQYRIKHMAAITLHNKCLLKLLLLIAALCLTCIHVVDTFTNMAICTCTYSDNSTSDCTNVCTIPSSYLFIASSLTPRSLAT